MPGQETINTAITEDEDPTVTDSESESSSEDEQSKQNEPSKTAAYNNDGLLDKLGDISWPEDIHWAHKLSFDIDQGQEIDANDDLNRELAFYTQALDGARQAFNKFQSTGFPFLRPTDYYAEMVKSDTHMEKVKGRLLSEKKRIEEAEERRKQRENKKLAKEIQAQKVKERAKQKKDDIESVKNWRKQRKQSGFEKLDGGDGGDLGFDFEDGKPFVRTGKKRPGVGPGDRSGGKGREIGGKGKKGFERKRKDVRDRKDSKFGFGGRKGLKKQNTAETTNDFRAFKRGGGGGGGGGGDFGKNKKQKTTR